MIFYQVYHGVMECAGKNRCESTDMAALSRTPA